jgi:hypothetical protein
MRGHAEMAMVGSCPIVNFILVGLNLLITRQGAFP